MVLPVRSSATWLRHRGALDDDGLQRDVGVGALRGRGHRSDGVDRLHARSHLAEDRVAPARSGGSGEVKRGIVHQIDEELAGGTVHDGGARHGDGSAQVLETVVRLVLDGRLGRFLDHVGSEASALDHEPAHHPVEDGPVVVPRLHVGEEVGHRDRRLRGVELEGDVTLAGLEDHDRVAGAGSRGGRRGRSRRGSAGTAGDGASRYNQDNHQDHYRTHYLCHVTNLHAKRHRRLRPHPLPNTIPSNPTSVKPLCRQVVLV